MEQVTFDDNGTRVAAVNTKTYIFQRNMSRGPESDLIRTANIPAMVSRSSVFALSFVCLVVFVLVFNLKKKMVSCLLV